MIYEIVCNETYERYIGSTFEPTLARRIAYHRRPTNKCMSKQIIGRGNYSYGLLEKVDTNNRDELRMAERKWYDTLDCINKIRPYVTKEEEKELTKEWHQDHKKYIKNYKEKYQQEHQEQHNLASKKYRQEHKEQLNLATKEYDLKHKEQRKKYNQEHKEQHNLANKAYRLKQKALKSSISPPLEQPI